MTIYDGLILLGYFIGFAICSIFIQKKYLRDIHYVFILGLFLSTVLIGFISAFLVQKGYEPDLLVVKRDVELLYHAIHNDWSLIGSLFLTGGNSIYPASYYKVLIASDTWPSASFWFTTRFYTFCALISSPNIYLLSLFSSMLAFCAKAIWLRLFIKLDIPVGQLKVACVFFTIGLTDIYFLTGMYKENFGFVCFTISAYCLYFRKRGLLWNLILCLALIHGFIVRFELFVISISVLIAYYIFWNLRSSITKYKVYALLILCEILVILYLSPLPAFILRNFRRFQQKRQGNSALAFYDWSGNFFEQVYHMINHIANVFYTHLPSLNGTPLYWMISLCTFSSLILLLFGMLIWKTQKIEAVNIVLLGIGIAGIVLIGLVVPNHLTQLRYRSIYFTLILFGVFVRFKHIRKNNI